MVYEPICASEEFEMRDSGRFPLERVSCASQHPISYIRARSFRLGMERHEKL